MALVVTTTPGGYWVWRMSRVRCRALTKDWGLLVLCSSSLEDSICYRWEWQLTVVRRLSGGLANVTRYTFSLTSLTVTLPESPMGTSKRVGVAFAMSGDVLLLLDRLE
jgi:hypothetical protein